MKSRWQLTREKDKNRAVRNTRRRGSFVSSLVTPQPSANGHGNGGQIDWTRRRITIVGVVFGLLWLILLTRAGYVQLVEGPRLAALAMRQHETTELITGNRGDILDRNGNVLARSVEFRSVFIQPRDVVDQQFTAKQLAAILKMPEKQVFATLNENRRFTWLARKVDDQTASAVKAAALPGVFLSTEYERVYPLKHLAGQLLGFVGVDDKGLDGLELSFNDQLTGQGTRKVVMRDAAGRKLYLNAKEGMDKITGTDLKLTLDINVQFFAEEALANSVVKNGAKWGGCLVVEVGSGEILAWAEYPFFNPNNISGTPQFVRRNKLAMDALEQGSSVKPVLIAAALQENIITKDSSFFCENGRWTLNGVTIRDDTKSHGNLTVNKILSYSSNIGMAKIGIQMGAEKYYRYLSRLGFGHKSTLPLAGESRGILRDYKHWQPIDLAAASFGQSFSATGIQVVQAFYPIANNGIKKNLRLVIDDNEQEFAPERIYSEEAARTVREMLREVVDSGTGKQARIPGVSVGGKTGTAQKVDRGGTSYGRGRVASFVGMVPSDEPKYLVFVVLDEPTRVSYGGVVAAPVFQQVALRTLAYYGQLPDVQPLLAELDENTDTTLLRKGGNPGSATIEAAITDLVRESTTPKMMPRMVGKSVRSAVEQLSRYGYVPQINGTGEMVVRQHPAPGTPWPGKEEEPKCILWLSEQS